MKFFQQKLVKIVFVLGGPGAGKGVQSRMLANSLNALHISAGDCLRQAIERKGEEAQRISSIIRSGNIVPAQITVGLLLKKISENESKFSKFFIDGFPRNQNNRQQWLKDARVEVSHLIHILCSEQQLRRRVLERGKVSGRQDDNTQSFINRMKVYRTQTLPVVQWWKKNEGSKVIEVQGEGAIEEVHQRLIKKFQ